jgi:hypothetical protein
MCTVLQVIYNYVVVILASIRISWHSITLTPSLMPQHYQQQYRLDTPHVATAPVPHTVVKWESSSLNSVVSVR